MTPNLAVKLGADRPVVVFDIETTGLSVISDRIVQLAYIKYSPDGTVTKDTMLFNPEMPIPPSVSAIHGLTDAMVKDAPVFRDRAEELGNVFAGCLFSGFNVAGFDLPLLRQEFSRAGRQFAYGSSDIVDAKAIYHYFEPRTLSTAYRYYCNKDHDGAHDAMADVTASAEILACQIDKYGLNEVREAQAASGLDYVDSDRKFYWKDGQICFAFAKHRHRPLQLVAEMERGYLEWMLSQDFSDEVKDIVRQALSGALPNRT